MNKNTQSTFECTPDEFFTASKEFFLSLAHLDKDQIDNGLKCLGLMYLGVDLDPYKDTQLLYKCAMVYQMSVKHAMQHGLR